ncbi:hypothetical protein AX17_001551 [Amanita inopinata Kibby_2008]|nr:hypothetical protein AX17_001551 [Amanita inopinata Kibby_2008]
MMKNVLVILFVTFTGICAAVARITYTTHHSGVHDAQLLGQGVDFVMPGIHSPERGRGHPFEGEIDLVERYYKRQPRDVDWHLLPRDSNADIVERQIGEGGADLLVKGITGIVNLIQDGIKKDKIARGEFTLHLVKEMQKKNPKFNYVVCHTKHETHFHGRQGKDWGHSHKEFDIKLGGTVGYEIYWARSGTFVLKGDGGYLNWAFIGNVKSRSKDGKTVVFARP